VPLRPLRSVPCRVASSHGRDVVWPWRSTLGHALEESSSDGRGISGEVTKSGRHHILLVSSADGKRIRRASVGSEMPAESDVAIEMRCAVQQLTHCLCV
jgi:hypothetical protein